MRKFLIIAAISILGISCETERAAIETAPENNLVENITLAGKLRRIAQHPTAVDNIIDNTSCFAVNFPFTVSVGSEEVTLDSAADYQEVINLLEEDDDDVVLHFPINVTYADYSTATISSQAELNAAINGCFASIELSCMDFVYPLMMKSYNSQNQLAETFTLGDKEALFDFLDNLDFYDAVALDFPLEFNTSATELPVTVTGNAQLETLIDGQIDECTAGLDPDPEYDFVDVITDGSWHVSYFFDDEDTTDDYSDFDFFFAPDGSILVTGTATPIMGLYNVTIDDGEEEVEFMFSIPELGDLEEDWTITVVTETHIEMQKVSGGGDDVRHLHFDKN